MSLPSRLLGANPSIQVSTLLSGSLTTPSAKGAFTDIGDFYSIASYTVTSTDTYIDFTSIPSTYNHLHIRAHTKTSESGASEVMLIQLNGDTTQTNYRSSGQYWVNGTANAYWAPDTNYLQRAIGSGSTSTYFGLTVGTIMDYKRTDKTKLFVGGGQALDGTAGASYAMFNHGFQWKNTAAITSIRIRPISSGSFVANTVISLYGIGGA